MILLLFYNYIYRWKTIQLQNFIFIIGSLAIATASSVEHICIGRFIVGIASSLSAIADIPYLMEISPIALRGRFTSVYEMLVVFGILLSFIINLLLSNIKGGWRIMFGIPSIFAGLQALLMLCIPESPKWLLENGFTEQAIQILELSISDRDELNAIVEEFQSGSGRGLAVEYQASTENDNNTAGHVEAKPEENHSFEQYLPNMISILVLMFFQQFTGGVVIRNYAAEIFESAGLSRHSSLVFTIALGAVKVIVTGWAILQVMQYVLYFTLSSVITYLSL